jgi:glycerol-3-phosphate dehydrogenase
MWSTPGLLSRLSGFFASRVMRGRTMTVTKSQRPVIFQNKKFKGKVYQLDEPVLDTASVVKALATPYINNTMHIKAGVDFSSGGVTGFTVETSGGERFNISTAKIILAAGEGNATLLKAMGREQPQMQVRPLQMVVVRGGLPEKLYAHCLGASVNPRITITSHEDRQGNIVWYMGGQLAEEGVRRTQEEQIDEAKKELGSLMPWLDFTKMQWATLNINRAEPKQQEGKRPDSSFCFEENNVITTWPTKLALSPRLAEDVIKQLQSDNVMKSTETNLPDFNHVPFADLPWQEQLNWK